MFLLAVVPFTPFRFRIVSIYVTTGPFPAEYALKTERERQSERDKERERESN